MKTIYGDENKKYKIVEKIKGDPVEWEAEGITKLCQTLITETDEKIKKQFFTQSLPKKFQNIDPNLSSLPVLFFDPHCSIGASKFNPGTISKSGVCSCIKHYANDTTGAYREFANKLAERGVLLKDEFSIIKCHSCKSITLGKGNKCSECGKSPKGEGKIYQLYRFSEEIIPILFNPGKIIEGIVFHSLKNKMKDKGYFIYPNLSLQKENGELFDFDLDTVVIDNRTPKALVILSSISPGARNERNQVEELKKIGIPALFITTGNTHEAQELAKITKDIIYEIYKVKNIEETISKEVQSFLS